MHRTVNMILALNNRYLSKIGQAEADRLRMNTEPSDASETRITLLKTLYQTGS